VQIELRRFPLPSLAEMGGGLQGSWAKGCCDPRLEDLGLLSNLVSNQPT
jgi:hypothetical protein